MNRWEFIAAPTTNENSNSDIRSIINSNLFSLEGMLKSCATVENRKFSETMKHEISVSEVS